MQRYLFTLCNILFLTECCYKCCIVLQDIESISPDYFRYIWCNDNSPSCLYHLFILDNVVLSTSNKLRHWYSHGYTQGTTTLSRGCVLWCTSSLLYLKDWVNMIKSQVWETSCFTSLLITSHISYLLGTQGHYQKHHHDSNNCKYCASPLTLYWQPSLNKVFIIITLCFVFLRTYFYFTYHMYIYSSKHRNEKIKQVTTCYFLC